MTIRPEAFPPMVMSKKTLGFDIELITEKKINSNSNEKKFNKMLSQKQRRDTVRTVEKNRLALPSGPALASKQVGGVFS